MPTEGLFNIHNPDSGEPEGTFLLAGANKLGFDEGEFKLKSAIDECCCEFDGGVTHACCFPDTSCQVLSEAECLAAGGSPHPNLDCSGPNFCFGSCPNCTGCPQTRCLLLSGFHIDSVVAPVSHLMCNGIIEMNTTDAFLCNTLGPVGTNHPTCDSTGGGTAIILSSITVFCTPPKDPVDWRLRMTIIFGFPGQHSIFYDIVTNNPCGFGSYTLSLDSLPPTLDLVSPGTIFIS